MTKEWKREYNRAWAKAHKERRLEINRQYRKRNRARLLERQRAKMAAMTAEERREFYKHNYELYKKRLAECPEYAEHRRAQVRAASLRYVSTHKAEVAARHRAYIEKNKERANERAREYWGKTENAERRRKNMKKWREAHREEILRKRREKRAANVESAKAKEREAEARRRLRKQTDAAYYHKRLVLNRMSHARARVLAGKVYHPRFHLRTPEWAAMGEAMDTASPWLIENLTPEQNAYARELAIERRERSL